MATVVHVKEKKTRFIDVDQEESMGIAKREPSGRAMGASNPESDILGIGGRITGCARRSQLLRLLRKCEEMLVIAKLVLKPDELMT